MSDNTTDDPIDNPVVPPSEDLSEETIPTDEKNEKTSNQETENRTFLCSPLAKA
jgi:hypothetical protein